MKCKKLPSWWQKPSSNLKRQYNREFFQELRACMDKAILEISIYDIKNPEVSMTPFKFYEIRNKRSTYLATYEVKDDEVKYFENFIDTRLYFTCDELKFLLKNTIEDIYMRAVECESLEREYKRSWRKYMLEHLGF